MEDKVDYWECDPDAECFKHTCVRDAVIARLDGLERAHWPAQITVYGWQQKEIDVQAEAECALSYAMEAIEETLGEEYGSPDEGVDLDPTPEESAQLLAIFAAIISRVESWACERVAEVKVDTAQFITEHLPEWLADPVTKAWVEASLK